jgi:hypothetical protein
MREPKALKPPLLTPQARYPSVNTPGSCCSLPNDVVPESCCSLSTDAAATELLDTLYMPGAHSAVHFQPTRSLHKLMSRLGQLDNRSQSAQAHVAPGAA